MQKQARVAFYTQGCKLNFSETSTISRQFQNEGYQKVDFNDKADIYVINTCSVTENADRECKRIVRSALKKAPEAFVVVIGCYAQLQPEQIAEIDGVDLVLGATEKFKLTDYINDLTKKHETEIHSCEVDDASFFVDAYSIGDRTRSFLKVQDGCDYKCTYCTIPMARGISRSDKLENILKNAKEISAKGIQEIVLTGVNIGDYGKGEFDDKKHEHTFLDLIKNLDKVEGINRIRISSIEPNLLKNETVEFVSQSKAFVPHFHIPLQSGSDTILKNMRRRYLSDLYIKRVKQIKEVMPHCCIGADVIVGFPGETNEEFLKTYHLLNELDVSYLHVFSYSERAKTLASEMENVVPKAVRNKRSKMLRVLSAKKRRHFYEQQLGSKRKVIFEGENKNGYMFGFTENYIRVKAPYNHKWVNRLKDCQLNIIDEDGVFIFEAA
ncbi:MAG: tRNA (N(6)-L-threonylcarbamoyladenosine(37)-C(2))-methylthiotransferase MtaB [Flavobacteriales bacterium]|nr:tRNA (N(6)-L-threonylcarbamoyladenosine(37)-C(2))-methylthiotransferase MtaB [Flavobacteriales bacterium]